MSAATTEMEVARVLEVSDQVLTEITGSATKGGQRELRREGSLG
jgi:hypothetical protein